MIALPSWQAASGSCGSMRSVPDVSFLADTSPGIAVYSTSDKGWIVLGGTSVGAPFIAGLYGAAGGLRRRRGGAAQLYANLNSLNAVPGVNGSPNGLAGF